MKKRAKEIRALETDIASAEARAATELAAIGAALEKADRAVIRNPELSVCLGRLDALAKSTGEDGGRIARIRASLDAVRTREEKRRDGERRLKEENGERDERMVDIGAGSWTRWRQLPDPAPWKAAFEEVERLQSASEGISRELREMDDPGRKRGFFGALFDFGSKLRKRGALSRIETQRREAFAAAGAKLAAGGFAKHAEGNLRLLFDFVSEKDRLIALLLEERRGHDAEIGRLQAALEALGAGKKPERRLAELEEALKAGKRDAEETRVRAGRIFVERDLRGELADAALSARFEVVASLAAQKQRIGESIGRLKAEQELEELAEREQALRKRRKALEDERLVKERQIGEIDGELAAAAKRREELRRIAGGP